MIKHIVNRKFLQEVIIEETDDINVETLTARTQKYKLCMMSLLQKGILGNLILIISITRISGLHLNCYMLLCFLHLYAIALSAEHSQKSKNLRNAVTHIVLKLSDKKKLRGLPLRGDAFGIDNPAMNVKRKLTLYLYLHLGTW